MPPSPALVRNGSKSAAVGGPSATGRGMPSSSAIPGPNSSAMAVKGIAPPGGGKRSSQQGGGGSHPYASTGGQGNGQGYDRNDSDYGGYNNNRMSNQQLNPAPIMSPVAATGNGGGGGQDYIEEEQHPQGGFSLIRFLTCRCG